MRRARITLSNKFESAFPGQCLSPTPNGKNELILLFLSEFGFLKYSLSGSNLSGMNFLGSLHSRVSKWRDEKLIRSNESLGIGTSQTDMSLSTVYRRDPSLGQ